MNELIAVYNLARKFIPHRLKYTAINNIMYVVKTPYVGVPANSTQLLHCVLLHFEQYF